MGVGDGGQTIANKSIVSTLKLGYLRRVIQAQVLVTVLFAVTAFSLPVRILWSLDPLLGISAALAGQVLPIRILIVGISMLVASFVVGRGFCGWICPLGFLQDLAWSAGDSLGKVVRGLRVYEESAVATDPSHLMISKGRKEVIGHVIWKEGAGREWWDDPEREALDKLGGDRGDSGELREIWLTEKHREKGLEKKVLSLFEGFARDRGLTSIVASPIRPSTVSLLKEGGYEEVTVADDHKVFRRLLRRKLGMPEELRYIKYVLLVGGLVMSLVAGWTILEWLTPLSIVPRALGPLWGPRDGMILSILLVLVALALLALSEKRFWCRYVCPLGAVLSLPSGRKAIGIRLDDRKCIKCLKCERGCPMGVIDVKGQSGLRWDSECIACLNCRDNCPTDAIGLAIFA